MQLGIESQIPDGLLAANALLAENSRQGVPTSTHTLHPGFEFAISSTYKGFQFRCSKSALDPVVAPSNACAPSGTAPSPSVYQQRGQTANGMLNSNDPYGMGPAASLFYNASELYQFKRGNALDAQVRYGGSPAYANYVFGVYLGAVGWTLPQTLAAANDYARTRSSYPNHPPMDPNYPSTPAANVANITAGYNAQQNGTLCHK